MNVSSTERLLSVASGAFFLLTAVSGPRRARPLSLLAGAGLMYRGVTGRCHGYDALGIDTAQGEEPRSLLETFNQVVRPHLPQNVPFLGQDSSGNSAERGMRYQQSIAIDKPAKELFQFWRKLENLPKVMRHLKSVTAQNAKESHWIAYGPLNKTVEWDAEIVDEQENAFIAWRSTKGDVDTAGSVAFRPLGKKGTTVDLDVKYNPPGGAWAAKIASLLGHGVDAEIDEDLRRFKSLMEAGEIPTVQGQSHGSRG